MTPMAPNPADDGGCEPTTAQLLAIIATQTEIARAGLDLDAAIDLVVRRAQEVSDAHGAVVEIADGDSLVCRAGSGDAQRFVGLQVPLDKSLSGLAIGARAVLYCEDADSDMRVDREACRTIGLRSMVVVPVVHGDTAVGVLKVYSAGRDAFSARDIRALSLMSDLIAAAMYHSATFSASELFRRATTDPLTGLANRALFFDRLHSTIATVKRDGRRTGLLIVDMDGLKPINDRFGHRAGDAAIHELAARLTLTARQSDTVARIGGDEFAFLLPGIADREGILRVVARIEATLTEPFVFEGQSLPLSASIGVAVCPDDAIWAEQLLELADAAMYRMKRKRQLGDDGRSWEPSLVQSLASTLRSPGSSPRVRVRARPR